MAMQNPGPDMVVDGNGNGNGIHDKNGESSKGPLSRKISQNIRGPFDEEMEWEGLEDEAASRRRRSSPATPVTPSRATSTPGSPPNGNGTGDKLRSAGRNKAGSPGEPTASMRRRPTTTEGSTRSRLSPLAKRLGEDVPVPYMVSQNYPGVMDLSMDGMKLDASMDDIMDPSAAPGRHGSNAGQQAQAGANIAPWLMDDSTPPRSGTTTPSAQTYTNVNANGPSGSNRPQLGRMQSDYSLHTVDSSRNGSSPSIIGVPTSQEPEGRTRTGSGDSLQNLPAGQQKPSKQSEYLPGGGRHSIAGGRIGRFSTVSSGSVGGAEKKKGFLGGLLKRKGTAMSLGPLNDPGPRDHHRTSPAGSTSSRISSSTSYSPFTAQDGSTAQDHDRDFSGAFSRHYPSMSDGMISPLQEIAEPEFHLDMNLDDMSGIIDPNVKTAQSAPSVPVPPPAPVSDSQPAPQSTGSSSSIGTGDGGGSAPPESSWALQDALQQTVQRSEGSSGSNASSQPSAPEGFRDSVVAANNPFTKVNPFQSDSSNGSLDFKPQTPPSPHAHAYSPKHHLPTPNQPRRPSQLRNVKMGSVDSSGSSGSRSDNQGPLQPSWAIMSPSQPTVFNDPFGPPKSTATIVETAEGERSVTDPSQQTMTADPATATAPSVAALGLALGATWAAPESWGVEGDEEYVNGDDESSSSGGEHGDWPAEDEPPSPDIMPERRPSLILPISEGKKPPPFGYKSKQLSGRPGSARPGTSNKSGRTKTRDGRPSTAVRPGTSNRPGTSGSAHLASGPHLIRIYRADGSYSVHSFKLMTTTQDMINVLSGNQSAPSGKRITTTMKLYLRERGQDRMLLPAEKPINIQSRRLQQAGFTEAEHIEELGREDLGTLCKFIYQNPALPVIDPEEESSYDSFEFIDIAGRDLQTIPIFLHLHAHNIIILNVSRNPMTDLPLDFIQACSSLKELRMTNMALKRVPASIRTSQTLSRLDVSSNRIADLESVPLHEIQSLLSLKVQNNKLTSIPSYFAQMKALKYLNISNNKFENFPSVVCEMSNLVDLDISFNNIAELPSEMSNLKSLERLLVYGNDLTTFPESFSTLANLRILDVRRNKLTDLNSVYALPNLATLEADYNNLVTLDAQIGAKVRQFSVPHNSVTRFTLAPLPNMQAVTYALTHLNLSHGKISTLADEALSGLINLVDLNLDFNQFTQLPSTLDRLVNLEKFSCTDNLINTFPTGFGQMQKLHTLNAHNNNLREIPADLWFCASLRTANFSSNLLESIPIAPADYDGSAEGRLPPSAYSVERMYFGDNHLTSEALEILTLVPGVKVINLSFNDIYEIPPYTLSRCENLEELYLSGNKLTSLPAEDLEKMQSLKVLHLNGNRLVTLPSELGAIKSLQHLDVGSNVLKYNIANWPYDWNWNWNTGLKYLNLSGNKRLEIKPTSAQDMSHASSLRKELSDFTALTELCMLGLMDVTLRIPSLPDESDTKRVRTSFSDINNMAYGISDMMGSTEQMAMFDMVIPNFRGKDNECLFGMFGRPAPTTPSGKVAKFLQESFASVLSQQLDELESYEHVTDAMRRSFLSANRQCFDYLTSVAQERKRSVASFSSVDDMFKAWSPGPTSLFRSGASGAVVYMVDKTLYCANAGHALVVLSRKGEAELLSKQHLCTDREETQRIRRAEAWVSTKGYINDDKDVDLARGFGYWHHAPALNAAPEIRVRELTEYDEFVIVGNNALWSCCTYQTAVDIARTERDDPMMAAQKLRDFAISYGAEGSVMVMVVNVSNLFGRGPRARGAGGGSGPQIMPDPSIGDTDHYSSFMRTVRRRYEEVGDRTLNRLQSEIEPPQGQIAIVFTDIVNSTHLWETNPGMPSAIKMHHNLMRRQLRLDGGYEVKTEGDSFMVSFQTVTAAILWAFNCQIGLLQQEWPRELLQCPDGDVVLDSEGNVVQRGLRVRMGVHWGSPQCERDPITRRMDYYGPMVNRAARINASADGGQLMASQDVIHEIELLRDYLDSLDEEGLSGLPTELKREVQEIRRIGIEMRDMGERKLKGLEVPERLHLLYPRTLAGRLEISNDIRANVEVTDPRTQQSISRQIDIDQVHELAALALRLEALSAVHHRPSPQSQIPQTPGSPAGSPGVGLDPSPKTLTVRPPPPPPPTTASQHLVPPSYLGPSIRGDLTDEELSIIIDSLTTRIENTMSTLYLKHLGGFSSVLAALEQATKMDPRLLVHALSLMNGQLQQ